MKTFDQIFPNLTPDSTYLIWVDGDEVRVTFTVHECGICKKSTKFYSISFGAFYCSIKCLNQEWQGYWKESRREVTDDSEMHMQPPSSGQDSRPTEQGGESNQGSN